jgi:hypothetical protein
MTSRTGAGAAGLLAAIVLAAAWIVPASASTWTVTKLKDDQVGGPLFGISCPSKGLCVATGSDSLIATSINPTGGRTAWKVVHPGGAAEGPAETAEELGKVIFPGAQIRGVSCPVTGLCVAVTLDGRIFSSTDPTGGSSAWKITPLGGEKEAHTHMTGISCPSPALCVAVAYGSKIVISTNPTGDRSAWSVVELAEPLDFRGVSCPSVFLCVAVDNEGKIVASANPTGPASAWGPAVSPAGLNGLNGIACPGVSFCVTGNAGQIITSISPTTTSSWKVVAAGTGLPVKGVSCPALTACAAIDNNADAIVSTNPTGGAAAWPFTNVIPSPSTPEGTPNGMFGISCPEMSLCVAAGQSEQIITSTDPFVVDLPKAPGKSKRLRAVITHHPAKRVNPGKRGAKVAFRFHAIGVGAKAARFRCKLGGRRFRPCRSPRRYLAGSGPHVFRVRALAPGGAKSPPASFHFRVGRLAEPQPVGSCRPKPPDFPSGQPFKPCINAH